MVPDWHRIDPAGAGDLLGVDLARGLPEGEAADRLVRHGPNALTESPGRSPWRLLLEQFSSALVVVLLGAALLSAGVGSLKDAGAIVAIVALNAALGVLQEYRAERAMAALKKLSVPMVRVLRDGEPKAVPARDVVPGDVVLLEAGNVVPADGRLIEVASLSVQESILTGESETVEKRTSALAGEGPLLPGDRNNMAFLGTTVSYGRGRMLVTSTGMDTELGRVAGLIRDAGRPETPLQRRLDRLGRVLAVFALFLLGAIFCLGILIGEEWRLMLMTAVSMAVAVVPEGLPAVVTIALALGAQRMLARNTLIRKLPAVETLGSVTVICSDKTGTLTENRMTVTVIDLAGHRLDIPEEIRHREPAIRVGEGPGRIVADEPAIALLLAGGALCNDARLQPDGNRPGKFRAAGDPTEGAMVVAAARFGLLKGPLEEAYPRVAEAPFDSDRKRMTTVHRVTGREPWIAEYAGLGAGARVAFAKGAVDTLLEVCTHVWEAGRATPLDGFWRRRIDVANGELARGGVRVLGVAFRPMRGDAIPAAGPAARLALERDMVFVGLVGMIDPPRPEVKEAVSNCRRAGIRPVMITGDHPVTARRIAQDLGIEAGGLVLTGAELSGMSAEQFDGKVGDVSVFARVAPEQKLRIVEALQRTGHVVAMTGDGVNDAPALQRADIGVAMGVTGTDVSREAAAMVLLDDNFSTIVVAVEEGRAIYDNIRRYLKFSLAGNLGKTVLVFAGPLLGMPLPLTPFQILWLNLVTDGILGLGIGVEPAERDAMRRPPHSPSEGVFSRGLGFQIVWVGLLLGAINLAVAWWTWSTGQAAWQTVVLTTVVLLQVVEAQANRSWRESVFRIDPFSNKPLLWATATICALQALVVCLPPLHGIFGTAPLALGQLAAPAIGCLLVLAATELSKRGMRRKAPA